MNNKNINKKKEFDKYAFYKMLGQNINYLRLSKNITLKEVSEKTGLRVDYLKKIEKGEAFGLSIEPFCLIVAVLQVKPSKLIEEWYRSFLSD